MTPAEICKMFEVPPYSVVILSKTPAKLEACIKAIRGNGCQANIRVVWDGDENWLGVGDWGRWEHIAPFVIDHGQKPFVFARNVNAAIQRIGRDPHNIPGDVILLNDDAQLTTPAGFDQMAAAANDPNGREFGVVSALILGGAAADDQMMGRPHAHAVLPGRIRECKHHMLAFVCVYIRRRVIDFVGLLDQRFTEYGYEDDDYCARVRQAGFKLGVFDPCIVEHGSIESDFRSRASAGTDMLAHNRAVFVRKWGADPTALAESQKGRWSIK